MDSTTLTATFTPLGRLPAEVDPYREFLRRAYQSVPLGVRRRDKLLIAWYYGIRILTLGSEQRVHRRGLLSFPYALADTRLDTGYGVFVCRKRTNDMDIVNPSYEAALVQRVGHLSCRVFVDVGAHIGKYTVLAARQVGPRGTVVAIEADPGNFETLEENVRTNGLSNVTLVNAACWDEETTLRLYRMSSENKGEHSVVSAVSSDFLDVPAHTLDAVLLDLGVDRVDAIKVDVEGAEPQVIRGASRTLAASPSAQVFFEAWDAGQLERCKAFLPSGYRITQIDPLNYIAEG